MAGQDTGGVRGLVRSTTGLPVPGAVVRILGTGQSVLADNAGRFSFDEVTTGTRVLEASSVGFERARATVRVVSGGSVVAELVLRSDPISLDGLLVTGLAGTVRRKEVGYAVSVVSAGDVGTAPVLDVADMLQGRASGVSVTSGSGLVGSAEVIRIRGVTSPLRSNEPLVYVDGVRMDAALDHVNRPLYQATSVLGEIAPHDVDRIEVLRGAAAATMFGAEAGGGVIQIFTKRGLTGRPVWSLAVDQGWSSLGRLGPSDALNPTGLGLQVCDSDVDPLFPPDSTCPAEGGWLRRGRTQRYDLAVRGGTEEVRYSASGGWSDERGVVRPAPGKAGQGEASWTFRANVDVRPAPTLGLDLSTSYTRRDIDWIPDGPAPDGFFRNVARGQNDATQGEDGRALDQDLQQSVDHLTTSIVLSHAPRSGVTQRLTASFDWSDDRLLQSYPLGHFRHSDGERTSALLQSRGFFAEYVASAETRRGDVVTGLSAGGQYRYAALGGLTGTAEGLAVPGPVLVGQTETTVARERASESESGALFAQGSVGLRDRLFVSAGVRVDRHPSELGEGTPRFARASVAYTMSEEGWFPAVLGDVKLRAALGRTGQLPPELSWTTLWSLAPVGEGGTGYRPSFIEGNPEVRPERTREWEVGLDGAAFRGRLQYEYSHYRQDVRDALARAWLPPSLRGRSWRWANIGRVENVGHELYVGGEVVTAGDVSWLMHGRISTQSSRLTELATSSVADALALGPDILAIVGEPLPSLCPGALENPSELAAPVVRAGCRGSSEPTRVVSVGSTLTIRDRVTLEVIVEGFSGFHLTPATAIDMARLGVWPGCRDTVARIDAGELDRLTAGERARCQPRVASAAGWDSAADFLRLRSLSLTYHVPLAWLPGDLRSASISLQGRDLWTSTDFPGIDPEATTRFADGTGLVSPGRIGWYSLPSPRQLLLAARLGM